MSVVPSKKKTAAAVAASDSRSHDTPENVALAADGDAQPVASADAAGADARPRRSKLRLTYVIASLDRLLRRHMSEALAPLGLTLAQFTALSVLDARGKLSNAQLAQRSFITPQSANEVVSIMASRQWITREPDPNHGRIVLLQLTDEGRRVLAQCEAVAKEIDTRMRAGVTRDDAAAVQRHLELFVRNLRD
ncbi:MarR family winged helix-turn-helix transcriptional regulator [Pandoraea sputorum]|uniref:Multiple antibiotic resistance protein marR n=1 Tax=Pandoraea sputorum TaxID=93222 RepID=A0A239SPB5_9BURK|nr:MarR family transcriptional regulator [Pandoraea sputorum]BET13509.1 MarR family transcriptional regulator [Pandoraea sputorum]SNU87305.1 Multiple antibiotic resistance protein marR [Pandoraea sputorum]VVE26693.1 MarR family transcriptional regulator [Pandoraea sputorum]VVE77926.1 MarR family transcriptional regulator [Pandoraea sputorum]